jgi:ABC-type transport system involved in cytochrome bd biosynthesis fused ATPase/permease subunit
LNFSIHRGELVGLSGISGKGKTTLINILLGFIEPASGSVFINGELTTADQRKNFREKISYTKQQSLIINDSIFNNISLKEVDVAEQKLQDVILSAGIETITKTENQSGYVIKENGKNISGGQKQRIAFARALYKEYDLLILDEPFNELDAEAELQMLQQLKLIAHKGKMILLITHNTGALALCDKVVLL